MAQKITLVDDLDGAPITDGDGGTLVYSVGGVTYSIDLGAENRAKFDAALAPFIAKSRRVSAGSPRPGRLRPHPVGGGTDVAKIREWARENGVAVSERGRVSGAVREAYEAAQR